jgi:beta-lactamase class A
MIVSSDNTATNLMISLLGGTEALNQQFRDWGLESTVLRNLLPDLDGTNTTSSRDLVRAIALVDQGELLSLRSRDRLFNIMQRTINRALIPDGLGDDSAIAYNKTGDIGTSLGDVALVDVFNGKRYLVSILVERPFNDGRASELIRRVSGRLYEEMSQPTNPIGGRTPSSAAPEGSPSSDEAPTTPDTVVPLETEPETYIAPDSQPLSDDLEVPPG